MNGTNNHKYKVIIMREDHLERMKKLIGHDINNRAKTAARGGYDNTQSVKANDRNIVPIVVSEYITPLTPQQLMQNYNQLYLQYNEILQLGTQALQSKLSSHH